MGYDRRCFRERQRKIVFRNAAHGFGELIPECDRERNGAAVAAGPRVGVGPKAVDARKEVRGHSHIAIPDMVEAYVSDLRPQPFQSLRDGDLDPLHLVSRADHGAPGDKTVSGIVAREVELTVGIGHRLPAGNDDLPRAFGQRLRRHLP